VMAVIFSTLAVSLYAPLLGHTRNTAESQVTAKVSP
jgi:hypothetical protein